MVEQAGDADSGSARRRLAQSFLPASAVLEMTYRCNHGCLFCSCPWFAPLGDYNIRPELGVTQWKQVISALCARGVWQLAFTGGEPLLKDGIEQIIEHAAGCVCEHFTTSRGELVTERGHPELSLLSNGKIMTEEMLQLCRKYDIRLSMSLPGLATFAEHTGGGEAERVLSWFQRAKQLGVRTVLGVTVTRRNLHELYETIAAGLLAGADVLLLNRFLPGGRGLAHMRDLLLDRAGVLEMLDVAEEVLRTANRYGSVGTELPLCILEGRHYEHLDVGSRCSAACSFFAVDPSGYVRVCNHSPVRLEHVSRIDRLRDDAYWQRFVQRNHSPAACAGCSLGHCCDAGCREAAHILTGSVNGLDPLLREQPAVPQDLLRVQNAKLLMK